MQHCITEDRILNAQVTYLLFHLSSPPSTLLQCILIHFCKKESLLPVGSLSPSCELSLPTLFHVQLMKQQVFPEPWYLSSTRLHCVTSHITLILILALNFEIVVFILRSLDCNINGNVSCAELNAVQHPGVSQLASSCSCLYN